MKFGGWFRDDIYTYMMNKNGSIASRKQAYAELKNDRRPSISLLIKLADVEVTGVPNVLEPDPELAAKRYRQCLESRNVYAATWSKANKSFVQLAKNNTMNPAITFAYASCCIAAVGVKPNPGYASYWFLLAHRAGSKAAARELFLVAENNDDGEAFYHYGEYLEYDEKEIDKALVYYQRSAKKGFKRALERIKALVVLYFGQATQGSDMALEKLQQLANCKKEPNVEAQFYLGQYYDHASSQSYTEAAVTRAAKYYERSASKFKASFKALETLFQKYPNDVSVQVHYSACIYYGYGCQRDRDRGRQLLRKAALRGSSFSQDVLGDCYTGVGAQQFLSATAYWYAQAILNKRGSTVDYLLKLEVREDPQAIFAKINAIAMVYPVLTQEQQASARKVANVAFDQMPEKSGLPAQTAMVRVFFRRSSGRGGLSRMDDSLRDSKHVFHHLYSGLRHLNGWEQTVDARAAMRELTIAAQANNASSAYAYMQISDCQTKAIGCVKSLSAASASLWQAFQLANTDDDFFTMEQAIHQLEKMTIEEKHENANLYLGRCYQLQAQRYALLPRAQSEYKEYFQLACERFEVMIKRGDKIAAAEKATLVEAHGQYLSSGKGYKNALQQYLAAEKLGSINACRLAAEAFAQGRTADGRSDFVKAGQSYANMVALACENKDVAAEAHGLQGQVEMRREQQLPLSQKWQTVIARLTVLAKANVVSAAGFLAGHYEQQAPLKACEFAISALASADKKMLAMSQQMLALLARLSDAHPSNQPIQKALSEYQVKQCYEKKDAPGLGKWAAKGEEKAKAFLLKLAADKNSAAYFELGRLSRQTDQGQAVDYFHQGRLLAIEQQKTADSKSCKIALEELAEDDWELIDVDAKDAAITFASVGDAAVAQRAQQSLWEGSLKKIKQQLHQDQRKVALKNLQELSTKYVPAKIYFLGLLKDPSNANRFFSAVLRGLFKHTRKRSVMVNSLTHELASQGHAKSMLSLAETLVNEKKIEGGFYWYAQAGLEDEKHAGVLRFEISRFAESKNDRTCCIVEIYNYLSFDVAVSGETQVRPGFDEALNQIQALFQQGKKPAGFEKKIQALRGLVETSDACGGEYPAVASAPPRLGVSDAGLFGTASGPSESEGYTNPSPESS